jgi:hypothetical protein
MEPKGDPDPNEYFTTPGGPRIFCSTGKLEEKKSKVQQG